LGLNGLIKDINSRLTYKIYEKTLWRQIKDGPKPYHVAVILDGNRRWAEKRGLPKWMGHRFGMERVDDLLHWLTDLDVKTLTIYVFSTENFSRPSEEVGEIMKLIETKLSDVLFNPEIHKMQVRIKAIGHLNLLPQGLRNLLKKVEDATCEYDNFYLNIAIAYGGRTEIVDATRKIAEKVRLGKLDPQEIDEETIERHLYTAYLPKSDPDMVIRTSGEERLSNFLLWQSAYSELFFLDVYWPDFRRIDLWRAIRTYQSRDRRIGK
jgi:tritrans,polycis-undecaprenyl-diphosphate synthase [geranylgeranyl-diphosphate specific]